MMVPDALANSLVELVEGIAVSPSLESLENTYLRQIRRFINSPAVGLYVLNPTTRGAEQYAASGVSDYFLTRYEETGRHKDPVLRNVLETRCATHSGALMSTDQWRSLEVYEEVFRLHRMVHLLQAPVVANGKLLGTLNFGRGDDSRPFNDRDTELATVIGRLVGVALDSLRTQEVLQRENEHLIAGLELCDEAVVLTDLRSGWRRLNAATCGILEKLPEGADGCYVDELMASERRGGERSVGRLEVTLSDGRGAVLQLRSMPLPENAAMLVSFLTLHGADVPDLPRFVEASLTPREREVAQLVALGFQDGEIADRLHLSKFTVKQYLKSTYRKLRLRSRVDLARLLTVPSSTGYPIEGTRKTPLSRE